MIMGVKSTEKAKLDAYQLKNVAQVLFYQWIQERAVDLVPLELEKLMIAFLERLFTLDMRKTKVLELINIFQGNMSLKKYASKFTQLSR